jgi:gliding motility-associated-like protein
VDNCGNAADDQTQTITISDNIKPTFTAPASLTINCEQNVEDLTITGDVIDEADNCSTGLEATFVDSVENGGCANENIITRTWSLVDACGNVSYNQVQTITVIDDKAPEVITEFESVISANCSDIPEAPALEFSDNCSTDVTVIYEETNSFDENNPSDYEVVRTWKVSDACNNEEIFTQTITVTLDNLVTTKSDRACSDNGPINLDSYLDNNQTGGNWTIVAGNATLDENIFDPENVELGNYKFSYTGTNDGCLNTIEVTIEIHDECIVLPCGREDVVISKVITPNGDSHNEFFTITGIEPCDFVIELQIFNRWGAKIYENFNYRNDWNGFAHSSSVGQADKVPNGTYYYIINLKNSGLKPFAKAFYVGTK